jgi:ABC-type phosphate transport system substrate-binding protein
MIQSGVRVFALLALVAVAACANATNSASNDPSAGTAPIASADGSNSVGKVSDALGQRLDGMLNGHQTGGAITR